MYTYTQIKTRSSQQKEGVTKINIVAGINTNTVKQTKRNMIIGKKKLTHGRTNA